MTGAPLDRARVAELIVTRAGERHRGSGYRVRTGTVLTAAHVVDGATSVRIRFQPDLPGERTVDAKSWWADPVSDIAVVQIDAEDPVPPVSFGRIDDRAAVLTVEAVGFPLWKMRTDASGLHYRDSCHAVGTVAVLSNWREGTLEVVVEPATPVEDDDSSPWQGMSGSALWAGGHVVGVIAKHHPGDGLGRLAAARVDLALDRVDPSRGMPLRDVLAVPAPLPGVLPPPRPALVADAYQALLAEAAPQHLHDRNWELGELVKFCAGDEPYLWWQAGPWAGKSALLAWFALHPPDGVDVVSFFITGRWAGQSDSDAFAEALIEQLAALVGEPPELALDARSRRGATLRLLKAAAAHSTAAGRTLLLVVDGLDEDTSRADGLNRQSIAAMLPRHPPPGVRVLVASRPHPDLPDDVEGTHPLRTIVPRTLSVSPYARNLEGEAKRELTALLARPGLHREVLGLITASGGGLARPDLEELTGQPAYELEALFGGMLGRSVGARASRDQDDPVYLFTHDTLREQAEAKYGNGIVAFRERLHAWADRHRERGWTEDTPAYLLRGYPRLLAAQADVPRLVACALDRPRHDRMLALTGGDALALSEIGTAAELLAGAADPDLATLLDVAAARAELGRRNVHIPSELPGVWALLGEVDRAIALANGLGDELRRAAALTGVVAALLDRGESDRAERLADDAERAAQQIFRPLQRYQQVLGLAKALVRGGLTQPAERIFTEIASVVPQIGDLYVREVVLGELTTLAAAFGDHEQALAFLAEMNNSYRRSTTSEDIALGLVGRNDDDLALRFVRCLEDYQQDLLLATLAYAVRSDVERAMRFVSAMSTMTRDEQLRVLAEGALADGDEHRALSFALRREDLDSLLTDLAGTARNKGDFAAATGFAREIEDPYRRAQQLCRLAMACAVAEDTTLAVRLSAEVEALLNHVVLDDERACLLAALSALAWRTGAPDREAELLRAADDIVHRIDDEASRARALVALATVALFGGDQDRYVALADAAETTAGQLADPEERADLLMELANAAKEVHEDERARSLVEATIATLDDVVDRSWRDHDLCVLAGSIGAADLVLRLVERDTAVGQLIPSLEAALDAGDDELAVRIANVVVRFTTAIGAEAVIDGFAELGMDDQVLDRAAATERFENARVLTSAATTAVRAGDDARALRFLGAIRSSFRRDDAFAEITATLVADGHADRASRFARGVETGADRDRALRELAEAAGQHGDHQRAVALLDEIADRSERALAVAGLARTAFAAGDTSGATRWCALTEEIARAGRGPENTDLLLSDLSQALARAGDHDRAARLARAVETPAGRVEVLAGVASSLLEDGDIDGAHVLAVEVAGIEHDEDGERFERAVELLLRTGDVAAADQVTSELGVVARECGDEFDREALFATLAGVLAGLNRHAEAVEQLVEVDSSVDVFRAWRGIASMSPQGPVFDRAREEIRARARQLSAELGTLYWLDEMAGALAVVGDFDLVLELLRGDRDPSDQADALNALPEFAPRDPERRRELFAQWEAAAAEITDVHHRDSVYATFSAARDKDGEHGEATRLAQLMSNPADREKALRDIRLRAIAAGRETAGARRFVAEVLATTDWREALPALARIDLPVLQRFADAVLG